MSTPDNHSSVTVRFAPSPTGYLHVGGARTALFNSLHHIRRGGRFIFRIEDTDRARDIEGAAERMLADLKWLGIEFNEGLGIGGEFGPYRQSERSAFYVDATHRLVANGAAYRCFCSPERINDLHEASNKAGKPPRYDRHCRKLPPGEVQARLARGESSVIRLSVETDKLTIIDDLVKGQISFDGANLDDPILVRSDGSPTGLLAGAVDDHLMKVSHIFRGDEWLPSTPYQHRIFDGLGGPVPEWGHLSLLVDENHAKLSKRTAGLSVGELRSEGILAEAICRYLAGLGRGTIPTGRGWNNSELAHDFDPTMYRSGEIVYSKSALLTENQKFLRTLSPEDLLNRFIGWNGDRDIFGNLSPTRQLVALSLAVESASTLSDCREGLKTLVLPPDPKLVEPENQPGFVNVLRTFQEELNTGDFSEADIQVALSSTGKKLSLKGRDLYFPIRLALTGQQHGPKLAAVMILLGKAEVLSRFEKYFEFF